MLVHVLYILVCDVQDPRLEGGYESVPTRDIHMKQIGFEPGWLHFLQFYVQPLQQRVYEGYWNDVRHTIDDR